MPVFDATTLLLFLEPDARAPLDPATNEPLTDAKARIDHLIETLEKQREAIVIPTPALSEVLVHANEAGPGSTIAGADKLVNVSTSHSAH